MLGHIADVNDAAADFLSYGTLLLGCGSDLLVHCLNVGDRLGNTAQRCTRLTAELYAADGQFAAAEHDAGHLARAALQGCNQCFNLDCGLLRALCQAADFVGNHGKTTPCFPGAGRFDGCVEGQQVGLFGHSLDDVHDLADLVAFLLQHVHCIG